ncbi:hypothetical protein Tco_0378071 [Tanacetum coccineum]
MTRSSTKELLSPFENPERVLRSRRKLFEVPSLAESSSPEFDQNSEIEEHIEEDEVTEIMAETMEQYMSKTRDEIRSGVARPIIDAAIQFKLKGQFLKELRDNTFSGSEQEDANEHIKKFKELPMKCPQHYLTDMQEVILFYNGLDVSTRQILDSRGVIPTKTAADAKTAIQEMAKYSHKLHNGTS